LASGFKVIVTAEDGTTTKTYTVTVLAAAPVVTPTVDYAAVAAAQAAAKAAADKLAAEKAAAEKAATEAKAAADKIAAEKAAAEAAARAIERAAAEAAAALQAEADAKAAAEAQAIVVAAEKKAAANKVVISKPTKSGTKINLDLADKYYGAIAYVEVGTKVKGVWKYTTLDYFVIATEDGTVSISTKKKFAKGQNLRVRVGKTVLFSKTY
jgi:ATPase subunit of ABC transporter with duplicated ATPase domains